MSGDNCQWLETQHGGLLLASDRAVTKAALEKSREVNILFVTSSLSYCISYWEKIKNTPQNDNMAPARPFAPKGNVI